MEPLELLPTWKNYSTCYYDIGKRLHRFLEKEGFLMAAGSKVGSRGECRLIVSSVSSRVIRGKKERLYQVHIQEEARKMISRT